MHPLSPFMRRILGVRLLDPGMALGRKDGTGVEDVGIVAELGLPGVAMGHVISIGLDPGQMIGDQHLALTRMWRAANLVPDVQALGLGSLCAVVAGRGEELAARLSMPVTTGGAATAWALHLNTRAALRAIGRPKGPVAVIGSSGPVGGAVAALLARDGVEVRVDHRRGARKQALAVFDSPDAAAEGAPVVVGAGPTGRTLSPSALARGALVIDVAIPGTVNGPPPLGVRVLAGEAVVPPPGWHRKVWGRLYQVFAGYGPRQVFACLVEPLVLAAQGRTEPYAIGRRVDLDDVQAFGLAAQELGFQPRLAKGWRGVRL